MIFESDIAQSIEPSLIFERLNQFGCTGQEQFDEAPRNRDLPGWPLAHESTGVLSHFPSDLWLAEFVLGNISLSEVYADSQLQIAIAVSPQRRVANCKRDGKAIRRVAEEGQQPAVLPDRRYQIVRCDACRSIKEQLMEISGQPDLFKNRLCLIVCYLCCQQTTNHFVTIELHNFRPVIHGPA